MLAPYWRSLPEDCVYLIFDFAGFPYPPRRNRCKEAYVIHCKETCDCCCERYTVAAVVFALILGFVMGEALTRI
jgi:hypothetical protein